MKKFLTTSKILVVTFGVFGAVFLLMPSTVGASIADCSNVYTPLSTYVTSQVAINKPDYVAVSDQTGVPWEMLAAIHYRETSFSRSNPSNGQGIFQFVNGDGGPYPPGPVTAEEFQRQLRYMANRIQSDYVYRGSLNYSKRPLTKNETEYFRIQDTLYSYNGRSGQYAQQAAQYGFSPVYQPFEGSPYVMNRFDCPRASMGLITQDYGSIDGLDTRYGAFTLYARLKGDEFWKSLITSGSFLVRTPSNPTYWLLTNGYRYAIPNGDILYAYGIQSQVVGVMSDGLLATVPDGGMLNTLFMVPGDPTVYLADGGKRVGIASGEYCTRWGLACGDPAVRKEVGQEIFNNMASGGILQPVMKHQNTFYLMENGVKQQFLSEKAMIERGYPIGASTVVINWTNAIRDLGFSLPEENSFVKFGSSSAIYAYANNSFYAIPDFDTFKGWMNTSTPSHFDTSSRYNVTLPTTIGSLPKLVRTADNRAWLLDGGVRINLDQVTTDWPTVLSAGALETLANRVPVGPSVTTQTTFRQPNGGIYRVSQSTKKPFSSVRDYFWLGYGSSPAIQISSNELPLPTGNTLLAPGSAYKIQGYDTIFMVGAGAKSYALTSMQQLSNFSVNSFIPTLAPADAAQFTYSGVTKSLVKDDEGKLYIVLSFGKIALSDTVVSQWGIDPSSAIHIGTVSANSIPSISRDLRFFAAQNGTIFIGEAGAKRPIGSYDMYKSLGGNTSNTTVVPNDLLDTLPTGSLY